MKKNQQYQNYIDRLSDHNLEKVAELAQDEFIEKLASVLLPAFEDVAGRMINTYIIKAAEAQEITNATSAQAPATSVVYDPVGRDNAGMISNVEDPTRDANTVRRSINEALASGHVDMIHKLIGSAREPELAEDYAAIALSLIDGYVLNGSLDPATADATKNDLTAALDAAISRKGLA